jgi:hypothetical protein
MPNYLVAWMIDIEADSPTEAALAALAIQRKPDSIAVVFKVRDKHTRTTTLVDLEPDDDCFACDNRGWDIVRAEPTSGDLGEIQRCALCKVLRDATAACEAARSAGFAVDREHRISQYPRGFSLDAWRLGQLAPREIAAGAT